MKMPRDVYGRQFADHCIRRWRYTEVQQVGSHIILRSTAPDAGTLSVPAHKPLRVGTLNALVRLVADQRCISRDQVLAGM